jgi:hypothetical protein
MHERKIKEINQIKNELEENKTINGIEIHE